MPTNPMEYIWPGIIVGQAIHAAAKLRIPDLLACGPKTIAELASECGAHPPTLERLLRALSTLEMFAPTGDGRFRNTPLTEVLRSDHPQSQRTAALFLPAPFLWLPLGELYESVRSGEPAFQRIFGQPFFDYLAAHSADAAVFNAAMTEGTRPMGGEQWFAAPSWKELQIRPPTPPANATADVSDRRLRAHGSGFPLASGGHRFLAHPHNLDKGIYADQES